MTQSTTRRLLSEEVSTFCATAHLQHLLQVKVLLTFNVLDFLIPPAPGEKVFSQPRHKVSKSHYEFTFRVLRADGLRAASLFLLWMMETTGFLLHDHDPGLFWQF